ncbi:MAG: TRAP transporter substrate-binding protein [Planctomycetes bacterium]|nr:TRAP transporter substrate-binding protein [Planctomycetota bacterium]
MGRRDFVGKAAVGIAGALAAGCTAGPSGSAPGAITQPRLRWKLVSSFPRSLDTIFGAAEVFADRVSSLTDGRFEMRVFPAGEVVGAFEVMDAVGRDVAQIAHSASYYFSGKEDAFVFDAAVPFGLEARQHMAWLSSAGGRELMRPLFAEHGLIQFPGGNTGVQMGGWFRREIHSLEDLKGLRMRIPGLGGKVMTALGATVQQIPGGEIYTSLERGAIDATEWVGPYDDEKLGFHQVAKNYYYPGWWEPGPGLSFYINLDAWAKLPSTYQAAVRAASEEASLWMLNQYDAEIPPALQRLVKAGVSLLPFPEDVMQRAYEATREILGDLAASDAKFREIYEHWSAFRRDSAKWLSTAELQYLKFAATLAS